MKVLHVIPSVAQVRGGPSRAALEMVHALQQQDLDVELVTTNDSGVTLLDVPLGQEICYEHCRTTFFARLSPPIAAFREFTFSSHLTTWLWDHLDQYDVVHVHALFSYPSTVAMSIARLKQIPYIVTPHGLLLNWSLQQSARKKQIYLTLIERANLNQAQVLHLTSALEQYESSQIGLTAPSLILPHGLTIPPMILDARVRLRQYLCLEPDQPIVLFLSRLHPKKGLDFLISALATLTHRRFTLVIAGSGLDDYEQQITQWLQTHQLGDRTHRVGFVEGEFKQLLLQGSDLFALTSHSENFGIAVLEALAAGLPTLVTPGVALADLVSQHRLGYVTEMEVGAIAAAIQDALDYPDKLREMGDRARQFILQYYTWDKIADQLIDVYKAICGDRHYDSDLLKPTQHDAGGDRPQHHFSKP